MRIIGIDPGTAIVGFSIIEKIQGNITLLDYGCIRTHSGLKMADRLNQIAEDLNFLIEKWKPAKASVEELFFTKNVKTAISVAQARGVIIQKLTESGVEIYEYTPLQIKLATCGDGKADKKMVQKMVKLILNLDHEPKPDDAADAIAVAICHSNSLNLEI